MFESTCKTVFISKLLMGVALAGTSVLAQADTIKIGLNSDLSATGSADFGISARAGAAEAIREINAAGGVLGEQLELVTRDDVGSPPKGIQNTNELVNNIGVKAMLGGVNSGNMLAWLHLVQNKKIPTISPVATATDITVRYVKAPQNYIFRVSMRDKDQLTLLTAYAAKASPEGKIAVIADTTGYGQQGAKDAVELLALHGVKPVAVEKFGPTDTDMTSQLNKIRSAGADTLIVYALADANAHVMRSLEKIDYWPTTLASWANLSSPFVRIAGADLAKKMIFTASITEDSSAQSKALYETLLKANDGRLPTYVMAAHAYDSVKLLAAAMEQAQSTDGEKVQQALENLKNVQGVIKAYDHPFTHENHEALSYKDFRLVRWEEGTVVSVDDKVTQSLTAADLKQ